MKKGKLKKMKQLCLLLSAIILGMSAVACGNDTAENQNADVQAFADDTSSENCATEDAVSGDDVNVDEDEGLTFDPDKYMFTVTDENGDTLLCYNIPNDYVIKGIEHEDYAISPVFTIVSDEQFNNENYTTASLYARFDYLPDLWSENSNNFELESTSTIETIVGDVEVERWCKNSDYDSGDDSFIFKGTTLYICDIAKITVDDQDIYIDLYYYKDIYQCMSTYDDNVSETTYDADELKELYSLAEILPKMFEERDDIPPLPELNIPDENISIDKNTSKVWLAGECFAIYNDLPNYDDEFNAYEDYNGSDYFSLFSLDSGTPRIYFQVYFDNLPEYFLYKYFSDMEQFGGEKNYVLIEEGEVETVNGPAKIYGFESGGEIKEEMAILHNNDCWIVVDSYLDYYDYPSNYLQSVLESL